VAAYLFRPVMRVDGALCEVEVFHSAQCTAQADSFLLIVYVN